MSSFVMQGLKRLALPVVVLLGVMIALGLLVSRVLTSTGEDAVNRELERQRTAELNDVSLVFSTIANTQVIIAVTGVAALALYLWLRRWREPAFLVAAVSAQALVFLLTTMAVDRQRPEVERMDGSLPTSSFPSGHTSAAIALYCGLALVLALHTRRSGLKVTWWVLLLMIPLGVALTRMYRGMHHPTDILGSLVNGVTCVVIMARGILDRTVEWGKAHLPAGRVPGQRRPVDSSRV